MVRYASLVAAVLAAAFLATPAFAAKHKFSCYDFAWQSQEMKDCLANPDKFMHKPMHKATHKPMHKATKKMKMKNMKDMPKKDMPEKKS